MMKSDAQLPGISGRFLLTYCDGGFGNRLNALLTGTILAEASGLPLQVVWPVNNWCGARFNEIFASEFSVLERELASFVPEKGLYQYLMTEDHLKQEVFFQSPLAAPSLEVLVADIQGDSKPVFLYTPLIPSCIPIDRVLAAVRRLLFCPELIGEAENFVQDRGLVDFYGLQIRKTDFGQNGADDDHLFNLVESSPTSRFFVCSDDRAVEERFAALPNVSINPKTAYVEKRNPGDWMDPTEDYSGRVYHGNINRSAQSVRDAIVDLLILSRSQIVKTSNSTFLASAMLLKSARPVAQLPMTAAPERAALEIPLFATLKALGLPAPRGILQVGASYGQELPYFLKNGVGYGLFIEPLPEPFAHLSEQCRRLPGYVALQALCTDQTGKDYTFHVASNGGMSSSILKPANHLKVFDSVEFPTTLQLTSNTLDHVVAFISQSGYGETVRHLDTLYMDTQGAEMSILLGGHETLRQINYIFTEVMRAELYEKQVPFQTMCAWLDAQGFTLNNLYFGAGHAGDALFIRKDILGM